MKNISEIKKRLSLYRSLLREFRQIEEICEKLESSVDMVKASVISGMPKGNGGDKDAVGRLVAKIEEARDEYNKKLDEMLCELHFIETLIKELEPTERLLMRKRYIEGKKWEEIADEMNYTWKHIHNIHNKCLKKIKSIYDYI